MSEKTYQELQTVLEKLDNKIKTLNTQIESIGGSNLTFENIMSNLPPSHPHPESPRKETFNSVDIYNRKHTTDFLQALEKLHELNMNIISISNRIKTAENNTLFNRLKEDTTKNRNTYQENITEIYQPLFSTTFWNTYGLNAITQPHNIENLKLFFLNEASYG